MYFKTTLINVLIMFFYMIPGFVFTKLKWTKPEHAKSVSAIMVYMCGPCMIINAFQTVEYSKYNLGHMGMFFLASLAVQILLVLILYLILKAKYDDAKYRILTIAAVFGNVGFFGLPLVKSLYPDYPIVSCYSSVYVMSMNLMAFTLGVYALTKEKKYMSLKSALLNPTTIGIFIALPLYCLQWHLPDELGNAVALLGKMTTPLCMIVLGMRLATSNILALFKRPFVYVACAFKLVIFPLFAYLCVVFLPFLDDVFKGTILILSAAPSAAIILSLAELHDTEQELAANVVLLSTLLCIISLPLLALLL